MPSEISVGLYCMPFRFFCLLYFPLFKGTVYTGISTICSRETNFVTSSLLSGTPKPFCEWFYSNRKECDPLGIIVFPFRADPFHKGEKVIWTELPPTEVYQFPL